LKAIFRVPFGIRRGAGALSWGRSFPATPLLYAGVGFVGAMEGIAINTAYTMATAHSMITIKRLAMKRDVIYVTAGQHTLDRGRRDDRRGGEYFICEITYICDYLCQI